MSIPNKKKELIMNLRKMTQEEAIEFCKHLDFFECDEIEEFGDITIYIDDDEKEGVNNDKNE